MGRGCAKKKTAIKTLENTKDNRPSLFKSIFNTTSSPPQARQPTFLPPEVFGGVQGSDAGQLLEDVAFASAWDVAIRFHELKARAGGSQNLRRLRKISAQAVLANAREVLGSVVRPAELRSAPWDELPSGAEEPDFDLEETLEAAPLAMAGVAARNAQSHPLTGGDLWMNFRLHKRQPVVIAVDTSLSMTGEKLALTAVALAVVLLQFPEDPVGIVVFENIAQVLKRPNEKISLLKFVERFLDVPAQGYTHLEDGLKAALNLVQAADLKKQGPPPSTVLLTDGKYTAGRDPAYLGHRFPHLVVVKMGKERASLGLCRELAQKGSGALREVGELESLPLVMYGVVKDLLRGHNKP